MIIHGNYAGNVSPKPDWNQTDPSKADYIRGKETVEMALAAKQAKHRTVALTLTASGWADGSQSVSCEGITAGSTLIVASDPENYEDYSKAGVYCAAQAEGSLTFLCKSVPAVDLTANVMILD